MTQRDEISQGFEYNIGVDVSEFNPLPTGVVWEAALFNKATNKRFLADHGVSSGNILQFSWPSGLKNMSGALVLDDDHKNGTAHMDVGNYNLEVYTNDLKIKGVCNDFAAVYTSNLMANNFDDNPEPAPNNE